MTTVRSASSCTSPTRNSRKPSSSSASRRSRRAPAPPGRRPRPARACARRAGAGRGTARRVRARARRRLRRSGRRAGRRRSRRVPRSGRSGRRARARGTARRSACAAAPCARPRRCPRRCGSPPARAIAVTSAECRMASVLVRSVPWRVVRPFRALRYDQAVADLDSARRAAVRRHRVGAARRASRTEPVQRRPSDAARLRGGGGCESRRLAGARRARSRWRAVVLVALAGATSARTASRRRPGGFVAALRIEPYENRVVLPHERTHAGPKEGRLRLLRATRTQLEPLFFLWDGTVERRRSRRARSGGVGRRPEPGSGVSTPSSPRARGGARRRAAPDRGRPSPLRDGARVPGRGRHRSVGLAAGRDRPDRPGRADDLPDASGRAERRRRVGHADRPAGRRAARAVLYRAGRYELLSGDGFLDPEVVEQIRPERRHVHAASRRGGRDGRSRRRGGRVPPAPDADRGRLGGRTARRRHAAEEHVLLSEAHLRPALLPLD